MMTRSQRARVLLPSSTWRAILPGPTLAVAVLLLTGPVGITGEQSTRSPKLDLPAAEATSEAEMKPYAEVIEHTEIKIEMVPIPGGQFLLGSPDTEVGHQQDESPQHLVQIDPFWMGKYEITWDEYEIWGDELDILRRNLTGMPATPRDPVADGMTRPTEAYTDMSFGMGMGRNPAICMTQHAARTYCHWLSAKTGRTYRLPSEAEWEYACRAGTSTAYSYGDDPQQLEEYAWYYENSEETYHEVGLKQPNPWGLYDMHGNVAEWVLDQYTVDFYGSQPDQVVKNPLAIPTQLYPRVVRGGCWDDPADMLRSAARDGSSKEWKDQDPQIPQSIWFYTDALGVGFRIIRPLLKPTDEQRATKWDKAEPLQINLKE